MTTIYYIFSLFFIWHELNWLTSPIEKMNNTRNFFELSKKFKGKKWDDYSKEFKTEVKSKLWLGLIFLWMFIGLFTFQWIAFLAIIVFNFLIMAPLNKLTKFSTIYIIINWFNSLIGFAFGVFVIVNHYHLKIDLTELFLSIIK